MDELVRAAMAKWPNVPEAYGWLALNARGEWLIRGERIGHAAMRAFIGRNYACTEDGRWYFQNGPQRVYVELEATPYVARLDDAGSGFVTHTGRAIERIEGVVQDDRGRLILITPLGPALLLDRDLMAALEHPALQRLGAKDAHLTQDAPWPLVPDAELPARYGFQRKPEPPPGMPAC